MIPVISIVGKSGVGKTTLMEKLIAELKRRGYRVATVKHTPHGFELDQPGKDTWRHARAGSDHVVLASPEWVVHIQRLKREPTLPEIIATIHDTDIVLVEGYKREPVPKIEVSRAELGRGLVCAPEKLIAVATDQPYNLNIPQFDLNDAVGLVDFIEERFLRGPKK